MQTSVVFYYSLATIVLKTDSSISKKNNILQHNCIKICL